VTKDLIEKKHSTVTWRNVKCLKLTCRKVN